MGKIQGHPAGKEGFFEVLVWMDLPAPAFLDKTIHSIGELVENARLNSLAMPGTSPESLSRKYGLKNYVKMGSSAARFRVSRIQIEKIAKDPSVAFVEGYYPIDPVAVPNPGFNTLATSSYNPVSQMPMDAGGQGVNVATFEDGLNVGFFNCLGNLASHRIATTTVPQGHGHETFKSL